MRYYIPTSTENFNNILSTESISPCSFYLKRGFGYKKLLPVRPNECDKYILLYSKYPEFEIDNQDEEAYPMIIEVEIENESFKEVCDGVFCSEKTHYLNPFNTKFIFGSADEKSSTIANSTRSVETKLVELYSSTFIEKSEDIESFKWRPVSADDCKWPEAADERSLIGDDIRIDKLKGFFYGYIIGANKSVGDKDYPELISLCNRLNNELSIAINRVGASRNVGASTFDNGLLKEVNKILVRRQEQKGLKPVARSIVERLKGSYPDSETQECDEELVAELIREDTWSFGPKHAQIENDCSVRPFAGETILDLQSYSADLMENVNAQFERKKIGPSLFPSVAENNSIEIPDQSDFLTTLIDNLLQFDGLAETIESSRYGFARQVGAVFKNYDKDKWDGSDSQKYINGLLRNLNESAPFDLAQINNLSLKSFAAFCKKGDRNELNSFYDFLIANGIGNVRIAFAIWGVVFGFAAMPKTITNELFQSGDTEYISDVYKHIYKQIFKTDLVGELAFSDLLTINDKTRTIESAANDNSSQTDSRFNETDGLESTVIADETLNDKNHLDSFWNSLFASKDRLRGFIKPKYLQADKSVEEAIKTIEQIRKDASNLDDVIKQITENGEQLGKKLTKDLIKQAKQLSMTLDSYESSPSQTKFYLDSDAVNKIRDVIPDEYYKKVQKQIEYIQTRIKKGSYSSAGQVIEYPDNSNVTAIEALSNLCHSDSYQTRNFKAPPEIWNNIIAKLKEIYL